MQLSKFQTDLLFGLYYEKIAIKYLLPYDRFKISEGNFKDYDIRTYKKIDTKNLYTYYEVKSDKIGYKTGNICIEIKCNGKPSGLSATKADYWIYFVIHKNMKTYDVYRIKTKRLKRLCDGKRVFCGGDSGTSEFHLLKIKDIEKYKIN